MMDDEGFYVYLASNTDDFAGNSGGSFRVHLPQKLHLPSAQRWRCALVELSFVRSSQTLNSDWQNAVDHIMFVDLGGKLKGVRLEPGYYDMPDELAATINNALAAPQVLPSGSIDRARAADPNFAEFFDNIEKRRQQKNDVKNARLDSTSLSYNMARNRITLTRHNRNHVRAVWFNPTVRQLLGIGEKQWFDGDADDALGENECDLKGGVDTFYVYTDIVRSQIVSNTNAPLLRAVGVPHIKFGERAVITFDSPHYIPLSISECDTISIVLRDTFGRIIRFERGEVFVKLHFRPHRQHILL